MAESWLRALTTAGAVALCLPTLRLTQVSVLARPRPRSVLVCVPAPCLSSTAQSDLRLHSVLGRSLPDVVFEHTFDGCQAAARGGRHSGAQELAPSPVVPPRWAPVPGQGRARGPDGRCAVEPAALRWLAGLHRPDAELGVF